MDKAGSDFLGEKHSNDHPFRVFCGKDGFGNQVIGPIGFSDGAIY
jgi:hypothetical protein